MSCALFELRYHCTAEKSTFEFGLVNQALASAYRTLVKVLWYVLKIKKIEIGSSLGVFYLGWFLAGFT